VAFRDKVRAEIVANMMGQHPLTRTVRIIITTDDRAEANTNDHEKQNEWLIGQAKKCQLTARTYFECAFDKEGDTEMVITPRPPDSLY